MIAADDVDLEIGGGFRLRRLLGPFLALLVIAAAGGGVYYYFFAGESGTPAAVKAETAQVTRGQLVSSFQTTGTANANLTSKLTFQASGQVKSISVGVGDHVTAGQELARLDDRDAGRRLESAAANLATAQIRLAQLREPPTASDVAAAQQSITGAQGQLANAQAALDKATRGPADTDVIAADAAVIQAEVSLQNANNNVGNNWTALINAQRNYCGSANILITPCYQSDIPLSDQTIRDLTDWIRAPGNAPAQVSAATAAASALMQANTSYLNSKASVAPAEKSLESAKAKRQALFDPPSATDLAQLQAAVANAQAGVVTAQAKADALLAGPTASDAALQEQAVRSAQISYQQQLDAMDNLVLRAPFDGNIGAIGVNVGDVAGSATAAMTLTDTSGMRIDLTVSETDIEGLKAGQYGLATFDALPGQQYVVKITGVSTQPTVSQGVVTYPVQAKVLRAADLAANQADIQKIGAVLQSAGGARQAGAGNGGRGAQAGGTRPAGTRPAGTPGPQGQATPGAGGQAGNGNGGFGGQGLQALLNAPLPAAGMSASVTVVLDVKEDALLLPSAAVKRLGSASYVLVAGPDGKPQQKPVTTGGTDNTNTVILTGLNEGDTVLLNAPTSTATTGRTTTAQAGGFPFGPTPAGGVR